MLFQKINYFSSKTIVYSEIKKPGDNDTHQKKSLHIKCFDVLILCAENM